ncbi:hypothetical protein PFISCL1PPCAC_19861, partial [Pristionchus fissidentatus]
LKYFQMLLRVWWTSVATGSRRALAAPSAKLVGTKEDKSFIDTEAPKIASHACINFYTQGDEPGPAIRANPEYPAWLFNMDVKKTDLLEDIDQSSWKYWRALRQRQIEQNRRIQKLKTRFLHLQKSPSMKN